MILFEIETFMIYKNASINKDIIFGKKQDDQFQ